jgi:hypothetical protein
MRMDVNPDGPVQLGLETVHGEPSSWMFIITRPAFCGEVKAKNLISIEYCNGCHEGYSAGLKTQRGGILKPNKRLPY